MSVLKRVWLWLKRLFRWLLYVVVVLVVLALILWGSFKGWLLWRDHQAGQLVQVHLLSESPHVTQEELKERLKPQLGLGFWQLDLPAIRQLVESHPWVAHAEVSRFWPNSLHIELVEHTPVARWGADSYLNQTGTIFKPDKLANDIDQNLITLSSVNPEPREVLAMLQSLLKLINPYGFHVQALHRQADGTWAVTLVNGDQWWLPKQKGLEVLNQFLMLYGSISHQENANMRVDLRYRDGFAVKWLPIVSTDQLESKP